MTPYAWHFIAAGVNTSTLDNNNTASLRPSDTAMMNTPEIVCFFNSEARPCAGYILSKLNERSDNSTTRLAGKLQIVHDEPFQ